MTPATTVAPATWASTPEAGGRSRPPRVLCVDDEPKMLSTLTRLLSRHFDIATAAGGAEALRVLAGSPPFAVVVSDMTMPGMDGITLLDEARAMAPDTVRILLTGNADVRAAIRAVNDGQLFRFLCKPCSESDLTAALSAGVEQHRLLTAQRELLEETLRGSIDALLEALALSNPLCFARATRVRHLVTAMVTATAAPDPWQIEIAAMLSQIGAVTLPEPVARKLHDGKALTDDEQVMVDRLPRIAEAMLARIPRLEGIREIIRLQHQHFDGTGGLPGGPVDTAIPLGARMLRIALDLDNLEASGLGRSDAIGLLRQRPGWYDPILLDVLGASAVPADHSIHEIPLRDLEAGMELLHDVKDESGVLLIGHGQIVTTSLLYRLRNWSTTRAIREPLVVRMPAGHQMVAVASGQALNADALASVGGT